MDEWRYGGGGWAAWVRGGMLRIHLLPNKKFTMADLISLHNFFALIKSWKCLYKIQD